MAPGWIRKRREELGIKTQEELATLLQLEGFEITRAAVSHWENLRNSPPLFDPKFRLVLSRVLKVPESDLLELSGFKLNQEHTQQAERAAFIVDQLPPEKRDMAVRILEQILAS